MDEGNRFHASSDGITRQTSTERKRGKTPMDGKKIHMLVVDDEKIQRDGILFLLKKSGLEFEISQCENGEEAYRLLKKGHVDILLTDIRMPFMDGMELISRVVPLAPDIKIILYSGYEDFEYARTAMSLGVHYYLRKPVDLEEFRDVITSVMGEVLETEKRQEENGKIKSCVRNYALCCLLNGTKNDQIQDLAGSLLGEKWVRQYNRIFLIHFEEEISEEEWKNAEEMIRHEADGICESVVLSAHQLAVLWDKRNRLNDFHYQARAQRMHRRLEDTLHRDCWIVAGEEVSDLLHIAEEMPQMRACLENRFWENGKRVLFFHQERKNALEEQYADGKILEIVRELAGQGDYAALQVVMQEYWDFHREKENSWLYSKFLCTSILHEIMQKSSIFSDFDIVSAVEQVYKSNRSDKVVALIQDVIEQARAFHESNAAKEQHPIVSIAKKYICKHYGEELDLEQLAESAHTSPRYLCRLFKEETGEGIGQYLKKYRLQKAQELLKSTNLKIKEIGRKTGYSSASYFCQSFREYFGISPEKFRNTPDFPGL
jgi:two-component system response regulator YesN